jgi:hypothetical protein
MARSWALSINEVYQIIDLILSSEESISKKLTMKYPDICLYTAKKKCSLRSKTVVAKKTDYI